MPMFTIRASNEEYAYIKTIADALGESVSSVTRDSVFELLDEWRARAKQAQDKLHGLPHGVTDAMVEEAAERLLAEINQANLLAIRTSELFSAKSKALYRLLAAVWQEKPDAAAQKFLKAVGDKVNTARAARPAEPEPAAAPAVPLDELPPPAVRKTRNFPPRAGKLGKGK